VHGDWWHTSGERGEQRYIRTTLASGEPRHIKGVGESGDSLRQGAQQVGGARNHIRVRPRLCHDEHWRNKPRPHIEGSISSEFYHACLLIPWRRPTHHPGAVRAQLCRTSIAKKLDRVERLERGSWDPL